MGQSYWPSQRITWTGCDLPLRLHWITPTPSVLGTTPVDTAVIGHLRANGEPIELSTRFATVPTDTRSPYNTAHLRCIRSRKVPQKYSG
jgi:hypothetical protein